MKVYEVRFFGDEIRADYIKVKKIGCDFKTLLFKCKYDFEIGNNLYYIYNSMAGFSYINSLKELSDKEIEKIKRYIKRKADK